MTDKFTLKERSRIMSRIAGRNTKPEIFVRSILHGLGYRFRIHAKNLPGKPDIVLSKHKKLIFVNGCFWHGHKNCKRSKRPSTNITFWNIKIESNIKRDAAVAKKLRILGWGVLIIWQCQAKNEALLKKKIIQFLNKKVKNGIEGRD